MKKQVMSVPPEVVRLREQVGTWSRSLVPLRDAEAAVLACEKRVSECIPADCCVCGSCGHAQAEPNWCHKCGHRTVPAPWVALHDAAVRRHTIAEIVDALREQAAALFAAAAGDHAEGQEIGWIDAVELIEATTWLIKGVAAVEDWAKSKQGQMVLREVGAAFGAIARAVASAARVAYNFLVITAPLWGPVFIGALRAITWAFNLLNKALQPDAKATQQWKDAVAWLRQGAINAFNFGKAVVQWVVGAFNDVKPVVQWVVDKIAWLLDKIDAFRRAAQDVGEFVTPGGDTGLFSDQGILGIPGVPGLAAGGAVTAAGTTLVGERGPELLDLPRGAQVTPLDRASGERGPYVLEATFITPSGEVLARQTVRAAKKRKASR